MMRPLLIVLIVVLTWPCAATAQNSKVIRYYPDHLTRADLNFFFDSVSFENGEWKFKLTPNTHGMLWRTRTKDSDLTGACESGATLDVQDSASLEIYNKGVDLILYKQSESEKAMYQASLTLKPEGSLSKETEVRWAWILPKAESDPNVFGIRMVFPED